MFFIIMGGDPVNITVKGQYCDSTGWGIGPIQATSIRPVKFCKSVDQRPGTGKMVVGQQQAITSPLLLYSFTATRPLLKQ